MEDHLIRPQVIENRRKRLLGEIVITQSHKDTWIVVVVCALIVLLLVWAVIAKFSRTEDVVGYVVSDKLEVNVNAARGGIVQDMLVKEGEKVLANQPLAYIFSDLKNHELGSVSTAMRDAVAKKKSNAIYKHKLLQSVASLENIRLQTALSAAVARKNTLEKQFSLQNSLVKSLHKTQERFSSLAEIGLVSQLELERRQQDVIMAKQRQEEIRQARDEAGFAVAIAQSKSESHIQEMALQLTQSHMDIDGLDRDIAAISADIGYTIIAPVAGTITMLQASKGKAVDAQFPLFTIRPEGAWFEVELLAPSRAIGLLEVGQHVNVMYDAFPYQKFGAVSGVIERISDTSVSPRDLDSRIEMSEPVYKIRVRLEQQYVDAYGERLPLHGGMTVRASIALDRRSFIDWLLEPISAVRGRL